MPDDLTIFYDLTLEDVLAIEAAAVAAIKASRVHMEVNAAGKSGRKEWTLPVAYVMQCCRRAKKQIAPEIYGRRCRVTYSRVACGD